MLPHALPRLVAGAACAASLIAVPSAFAATTYDLSATGTVQYLRKEVFADDRTRAATEQQAAFGFATVVTGLELDVNQNLVGEGTPATTISDVRGAYRATVEGDRGSLNGSCSATQGKVVVPGALDEPELQPLTGDKDWALRVFNQIDIPMTGCTKDVAADHTVSLTHFNEPMPESALDTLVRVPASAFQSDVSTGELEVATPGARCPLFVEGMTTTCSIAIQGTWTLTKTTDGTPSPQTPPPASPGQPDAPPRPDGPAGPVKPIGGNGKVTGSARWAGDRRRVKVRVTCSEACKGTVAINLPGGGPRVGRPVTIDLPAGGSRTVSFRVARSQRKALERARRVGLRYGATGGETPTTATRVPVAGKR